MVLSSDDTFDAGSSDSIHERPSSSSFYLSDAVPIEVILFYLVATHEDLPTASSSLFKTVISHLNKFYVVRV